jgi:AcrR family transcriptional regulator
MPSSNPRQALLDAVVTYASHHGVSHLSLRELARAVGTSHRMLLYHFGSKEELLVAIVEANESAQRAAVTSALAGGDDPPSDVLRSAWDRLADPSMWPSERLFFELYGQALQGRPGTTALLDGIVTSWIEPTAELLLAQGAEADEARAGARLGMAVVRGLLLDLLATGDRAGVGAAMDLFLGLADAPRPGADVEPASGH